MEVVTTQKRICETIVASSPQTWRANRKNGRAHATIAAGGMRVVGWKLRARVFLERLWQPTCACITIMTAPSFANLVCAVYWKIVLQTGVATGWRRYSQQRRSVNSSRIVTATPGWWAA